MNITQTFGLAITLAAAIDTGAAFADSDATTQAATQPAAPSTQPALVTAPTKPDEYLTQDQLVLAYRQKQFALVAKEASRILGNAKVAVTYDRFALQVLRGESFLQQKNFEMAQNVYASAVADAPDADKRAVMTATALMIQKRTGVKYLSWTTDERGVPIYPAGMKGKQPIAMDILDLSKREAIFRALCWDQAAAIRGAIHAIADTAGNLKLVDGTLDGIDRFSLLETAARGSQEETGKMKKDLAVAVQGALTAQLTGQRLRIAEITKSAMEATPVRVQSSTVPAVRDPRVPVSPGVPTTRDEAIVSQLRGLDQASVKELEDIAATAGKVPRGVEEVTRRLGADPKTFDGVVKDAKTIKDSADGTIEHYKSAGLLR